MARELDLSDEMVRKALGAYTGKEAVGDENAMDDMRNALNAAFEDVPLTNYGIGLALGVFDLVIGVKEDGMTPRVLVCQKNGQPHSFDTLGHHVSVSWGTKPRRYIKSVAISQIDPPEASDAA